jgi:pyruvate dehydrogenase E1 component beta subunit
MFAQVPGLRVLYPVHPRGISCWLEEALTCGWPTVILEPRRLYEVDEIHFPAWDRPDIFLVTFGDVVLDAAVAASHLASEGIKAQVYPIEDVTAMQVPEADVPVVVADTGHLFCGASAEVAARLAERGNSKVKRVGPPFITLPTSAALEQEWYPTAQDLLQAVGDLLGIDPAVAQAARVAEGKFVGPF